MNSSNNPVLIIVLPCFNEEAVLPSSLERLSVLLDEMISSSVVSEKSRLLFVNDGSKDKTWDIITSSFNDNPYACGLNLAANVGHQNALLAGLELAQDKADIVITIDSDLQDDINKIPEMVQKYNNGADIVYGVKNDRKADSFFKRFTARLFYKLMSVLGVKSVYNHADFRLLSRRAVTQLCRFRERNLYLRGIIPLIGFKEDYVYENLSERKAGESKYNLGRMINLAANGITSFSVKPLHVIMGVGFIFILMSFAIMLYVLVGLIRGVAVPGWASIMLSMWFIGGCLLVGMGIMGWYIGAIYLEVKDRPRYIIESKLVK